MDLQQKSDALYNRILKTVHLSAKINMTSGVAKADLGSAMVTATETQDNITTPLGETLSPAPSDANGIFYVALVGEEVGEMAKALRCEVISAPAAYGTVAASVSLSASGNLLVELDSDQDITGDDGDLELMITYLMK